MQLAARPRPETGRMGAKTRAKDDEFTAYLHARQPSLLRTAYLLTGDRNHAEDILQTSLAKLYLAWDKVRDRDSVDAYVRRIMVNENNSMWRRGWKKREFATEVEVLNSGVTARSATTTTRAPTTPSGRWCRACRRRRVRSSSSATTNS